MSLVIENSKKKQKKKQKKENKQRQKEDKNAIKKAAKAIIREVTKPTQVFNPINNTVRNINYFINEKKRRVNEWIASILDPAIAVESGKIVKQPSTMPIWSTTISYRNRFTIETDAAGEFFIAWNPNFLTDQSILPTNTISYTNGAIANIKGVAHICQKRFDSNLGDDTLVFYPGYMPSVSMSKYRLVSAKISVSYIGPRIEKSGIMYACATYDPTPIRYTNTTSSEPHYIRGIGGAPIALRTTGLNGFEIEKNTLNMMDESKISNGIFNKMVNVQASDRSISCIHIPVDPSSKTFQDMGSYFGEKFTQPNLTGYTEPLDTNVCFYNPIIDTSPEGTQVCYLICGTGLPSNKTCMNITVYYNFEVIPTTTNAPFMRSIATNEFDPTEHEYVAKVIEGIPPATSIRDEPASQAVGQSKLNSLINSMNKGIDTINNAANLASSISKLFSGGKF